MVPYEFRENFAIVFVGSNACQSVLRSRVDLVHDSDLVILFFSCLVNADSIHPYIFTGFGGKGLLERVLAVTQRLETTAVERNVCRLIGIASHI